MSALVKSRKCRRPVGRPGKPLNGLLLSLHCFPLLLHQESVSEAKRVFQTQSEERAEKREAPEATHEYSGPHYDSSSRRVQTDKFLGLLQQFACVVHIDQK